MMSRRRGCGRQLGDGSSGPLGQDVLDRLRLLLRGGELLGEALHRITEKVSLGDQGVQEAVLVGLPHICQGKPKVAFLDH